MVVVLVSGVLVSGTAVPGTAVPGTAADGGEAFPEGQHIAIGRWTSTLEPEQGDAPEFDGEPGESGYGILEYCSEPSGEALNDFMLRWPYTNSVEPLGA